VIWVAAWAVLLYLVVRPWLDLGGLVGERMRWLEAFVLVAALLAGHTAGEYGREVSGPASGRSHATLLRFVVLIPATLTATALVVLRLIEQHDLTGIVLTGFVAQWAGFDFGFGAMPLIQGRSYRFRGPIDRDPLTEQDTEGDSDFNWWHGY